MRPKIARLLTATAGLLALWSAHAQGQIVIDTVPVGDIDNTPDFRYTAEGWGGVDYPYEMGMYEVTAGQYAAFLNAVAVESDPYTLYDERMWTHEKGCKIERTGAPGDYSYSVAPEWAHRPVNYVNWGDSARFANWMHNGQPVGPVGLETTEDGSYFINGATSNPQLIEVQRQPDATWVLPTLDEWYKAAYYDADLDLYYDFGTSSSENPSNELIDPDPGNNATFEDENENQTLGPPYYRTEVGAHENSFSPYRAFDMAGNVWEFNEEIYSGIYRGLRGGSFNAPLANIRADFDMKYFPLLDGFGFGFRVAYVPPAPCRGDADCDGDVDFDDIAYFVAALAGQAAWEAKFDGDPTCSFDNNDVDSNGMVDFDDIAAFVAALSDGECAP